MPGSRTEEISLRQSEERANGVHYRIRSVRFRTNKLRAFRDFWYSLGNAYHGPDSSDDLKKSYDSVVFLDFPFFHLDHGLLQFLEAKNVVFHLHIRLARYV